MKKISVLMLMMMLSLFSVNTCFAQHRIETKKSESKEAHKKVDDRVWSRQEEEAINKKKSKPVEKQVEKIIIKEQVIVKEEKVVEQPKIEISNPCFDDISVELVSLEGNKSSQQVTITISFTNHQINKNVYIKNFNAYNEEGDHFDTWNIGSFTTLTDITQKTSWKVGQMLPSKNSKLTAITFQIDGCTVEMRNLPIDWR